MKKGILLFSFSKITPIKSIRYVEPANIRTCAELCYATYSSNDELTFIEDDTILYICADNNDQDDLLTTGCFSFSHNTLRYNAERLCQCSDLRTRITSYKTLYSRVIHEELVLHFL